MTSLTLDELNIRKKTLKSGMGKPIPAFSILRRYEDLYDSINKYLTSEERFNYESQFARHENFLSESSGLSLRPSPREIEQQFMRARNEAYTGRVQAYSSVPPSGAGERRRRRSRSEEALVARESIDWDNI